MTMYIQEIILFMLDIKQEYTVYSYMYVYGTVKTQQGVLCFLIDWHGMRKTAVQNNEHYFYMVIILRNSSSTLSIVDPTQ